MKSRPYQRHDREKRLSMLEQRFRQHHVDIQRLWKRSNGLDVGIPTSGIAVGVDEEEEATGGTHTQCRLLAREYDDQRAAGSATSSPYTQAGYIRDQWTSPQLAGGPIDRQRAVCRMIWPSGNTTGHASDWLVAKGFGFPIQDDAENVSLWIRIYGFIDGSFSGAFGVVLPYKVRLHNNGVAVSAEISGSQIAFDISSGYATLASNVTFLPGVDPVATIRSPNFGAMFRFYKDTPPTSGGGNPGLNVDAVLLSLVYYVSEYTGCSTSYEPGA